MSSQRIDYTNGGDTGYTDSDSIQPIEDGESANQTTFRRTPENLRSRTEIVRDALEDNLYVRDADRVLGLFGGGTISYGGNTTSAGTGVFTTTADMYLIPFNTVGNAGSTPPVASKFGTLTLNRTGPAAGLTITSKKRSYEGGDKITVEIILDNGISGNTEVSVEDTYRIKIKVKTATTLSQVSSGISGEAAANALVGSALAGGAGSGDVILSPQAEQTISGNMDGEAHVITAAVWASFFGTVANKLAEGDTLAIWYNQNIEGTVSADTSDPKGGVLGGRRESIPENSNTSIPVGSLFNSRLHPERLPNALPVCKVVNDILYFINGSTVVKNGTATLGTSGFVLSTDLASTSASKGASLVGIQDVAALITATTVEGALAELAAGRVLRAGDTVSGNLLTNTTGNDLGSSTAKWDVFSQDLKVYNSITTGAANTVDIGTVGVPFGGIHGSTLSADGVGSTTVVAYFSGQNLAAITSGCVMETIGKSGVVGEMWDGYGIRQRYGLEFVEDFHGESFDPVTSEISTSRWTQTVDGSSTTNMSTSFSTSAELVTGSSTNNAVFLRTRNLLVSTTKFPHVFARIRFSAAMTSRKDIIGLDFLYFIRDTAVSNNFKVTSSSSIDTGFAPSINTWYYLNMQVTGASTIDWAIGSTPFFTSALASGTGDAITYTTTASEAALTTVALSNSSRTLVVDYLKISSGSIV